MFLTIIFYIMHFPALYEALKRQSTPKTGQIGSKMAHLEFRGKMPKIMKNGQNHDFSKNIARASLCES